MPQMFSSSSSFFHSGEAETHPHPVMSPVSVARRSSSSENSDPGKRNDIPHLDIPQDSADSVESYEKRDKARKAGKYLKLILHCQSCRGKCNTQICKNTRLLLNHCAPCQNRDMCPIKGCFQTKKLLCHMIACRHERQNARRSGVEPKTCLICSAVETSPDETPHDNTSTDSRQPSFDMDGFMRPTMLPRRFRSSTHAVDGPPVINVHEYNCKTIAVEEEPDEMEDDSCNIFRSRRHTSI